MRKDGYVLEDDGRRFGNAHVQDHGGPAMGCSDTVSAPQDDFGASRREMGLYARAAARMATPQRPAAPTPLPRASGQRSSPPASGGRATRAGEVLPRRAPREGRRQMQ